MALAKVKRMPGREGAEDNGRGLRTIRLIDMPTSYTTGGESLTTAQLGFGEKVPPDWVDVEPKAGYLFEYDATNKKIKAFRFDYPAAAAGAAVEVANGVDLSAVTGVIVKAYSRYE